MAFGSLSLKARALKALASREHSRLELTRKLAPHAESAEVLEALLNTLEAQGLLSQQRFVESLVRRRGAKLGSLRIRQELNQHQLDAELVSTALADLRTSELERARTVWLRRFGVPAEDATERARQGRFLTQRGFSGDVVARVLRQPVVDAAAPEPAPPEDDLPADKHQAAPPGRGGWGQQE